MIALRLFDTRAPPICVMVLNARPAGAVPGGLWGLVVLGSLIRGQWDTYAEFDLRGRPRLSVAGSFDWLRFMHLAVFLGACDRRSVSSVLLPGFRCLTTQEILEG